MIRAVHAVVLRSPKVTEANGWQASDAILRAVSGARSVEEFETRAKQVPLPGVRIVVERLAEFNANGRTAQDDAFDPDFTAAAFALRTPGETSDIVETAYGWHVIRLMERLAPEAASLEQRRKELAGPVVEMRARARLIAVRQERRRRTPVEITSAADMLMAGVEVETSGDR